MKIAGRTYTQRECAIVFWLENFTSILSFTVASIAAAVGGDATVRVDVVSAVAKSKTVKLHGICKSASENESYGIETSTTDVLYVRNVAVSLIWVDVKIRCKTQSEIKAIDVDTKRTQAGRHIGTHAHPEHIFNMGMKRANVCACSSQQHSRIDKR